MSKQEALDKVRKLLAKANDSAVDEAESAAFAAKAQQIMDRYRIESFMLEKSKEEVEETEEIKDWADPLDPSRRMPSWRVALSQGIAHANGCQVYYSGCGGLNIIGCASDVEMVRYMYAFCVGQVDRMAKAFKGNGRRWITSWRYGVASTVCKRMKESIHEIGLQLASEGTALVVVENAIIAMDDKLRASKRFGRVSLGLRSKSSAGYNPNYDAYARGKHDGRRVDIGNTRRLE